MRTISIIAVMACAASFAGCGASPRVSSAAHTASTHTASSPKVLTSFERLAESLGGTTLRTQDGREVRFYDDLLKGKVALINFIFTSCTSLCPMSTANLLLVQKQLGDRVGRDIVILSISVDPERDTPAALKKFADSYGTKPGWYFLTGKKEDVDRIRRRLGVYDPDLAKDADGLEHTGLLTYGNEPSGRWSAMYVLAKPKDIVDAVNRVSFLQTLR